uniref:Uncharacterized protein n=1 Tax=Setaria italica TaxID=4555 RepID=K3ZKJ1_SETIT
MPEQNHFIVHTLQKEKSHGFNKISNWNFLLLYLVLYCCIYGVWLVLGNNPIMTEVLYTLLRMIIFHINKWIYLINSILSHLVQNEVNSLFL